MKRADIIQDGVYAAKRGHVGTASKVKVLDTRPYASSRYQRPSTAPFLQEKGGPNVLVEFLEHNQEYRYGVLPLAAIRRTWVEHEERLAAAQRQTEEIIAREAERKAAHDAEVAGIERLARQVGLTVGCAWTDHPIRVDSKPDSRYEITAEALTALLEAATGAPQSTPITLEA